MSYDIITSIRIEEDLTHKMWVKSLSDHLIPFEFNEEFNIFKHEGLITGKYLGEEVEFEWYYKYPEGVQVRGQFIFCTYGDDSSVLAAKAVAMGISLLADGIITDPQTGEKWKGKRALKKLLTEVGGNIDSNQKSALMRKKYNPNEDFSKQLYESHLKAMGFNYYIKTKNEVILIKEFPHFIHGIRFGTRMWSSKSFSFEIKVFVSFDNLKQDMGIEWERKSISMTFQKSIKKFPFPPELGKSWPHEVFETDEEIFAVYRKYLPKLIQWHHEVDTLEKLSAYPKAGNSPWSEFIRGRLYDLMGDKKMAREWYQKCIDECEDNELLNKAEWLTQLHKIVTKQLKSLS